MLPASGSPRSRSTSKAAMAVGAFLSGASARHLSARMGPTRVVVLGLALEVLGAAATALAVGASASAWVVAACLVPYGLGLGLASAQLTSTTLRDVPPASSGAGSATQSTVRQLGSALGSALGGLMLSTFLGTSGRGGTGRSRSGASRSSGSRRRRGPCRGSRQRARRW